jgi:hypothetical protein
MKRIILAATMVLAFTGAAQAEKYLCQVQVGVLCGVKQGTACARANPPYVYERYVVDTKAKTLVWCDGPKKSDCFGGKAKMHEWEHGLNAMSLGGTTKFVNISKTTNEFVAFNPSGGIHFTGGFGTCITQ